MAFLVVAPAMLGLGYLIDRTIVDGIAQGVATTAAGSIDSIISHEISQIGTQGVLDGNKKAALDSLFAAENDATTSQLLQIRLFDLKGKLFYSSNDIFGDASQRKTIDLPSGTPTVTFYMDNPSLNAVGPIGRMPISTLYVLTPLHDVGSKAIFAYAELIYSARSLLAIERGAHLAVWIVVGVVGLAVIAVLYLLVNRANNTILLQQKRLADNLAVSRSLARENQSLHAASERLRINANLANENLLTQVGSDIHDGPIQLIAVMILRITRQLRQGAPDAAKARQEVEEIARLATDAIEDLRSISAGLVLPELGSLTLESTIRLAATRHAMLSGLEVQVDLEHLPEETTMDLRTVAYRIVQEALGNAYRHGEPTPPEVTATEVADQLLIEVSNVARSSLTPSATTSDGNGLGLHGMRLRAESLGGSIEMVREASGRVVLRARIPCQSRVRPSPASSVSDPSIS